MTDRKIKVLYIAGDGRSGSTILGNLLGQLEGFFHGGELRYIWDRCLVKNWSCGCGVPFGDCSIWKAVLQTAFGRADDINVDELIALGKKGDRTRYVPLMLLPWGRRSLKRRLGRYLAAVEKMYQAMGSASGTKVIVDSSKYPSYEYVLHLLPTIDVYIVHLIRDSRAVAYSWLQQKILEPREDEYLPQRHPLYSAFRWNVLNMAVEAFARRWAKRYLRLRYEDFVAHPRAAIQQILDMVEEHPAQLPFETEHKVRLGTNHTVAGNPNRFQIGSFELRQDARWKHAMKSLDRIQVTLLTWPLLRRYAYL